MAEKSVIEKVKNFIDVLKEEGIEPERVILYGSSVNNTNDEESDIDILLVSKDGEKYDDIKIGLIWSLTKRVDTKIEPYIIDYERFMMDDVSPLLQIVKSEGILVN